MRVESVQASILDQDLGYNFIYVNCLSFTDGRAVDFGFRCIYLSTTSILVADVSNVKGNQPALWIKQTRNIYAPTGKPRKTYLIEDKWGLYPRIVDFENDIVMLNQNQSTTRMNVFIFDLRLRQMFPIAQFSRVGYLEKGFRIYSVKNELKALVGGFSEANFYLTKNLVFKKSFNNYRWIFKSIISSYSESSSAFATQEEEIVLSKMYPRLKVAA